MPKTPGGRGDDQIAEGLIVLAHQAAAGDHEAKATLAQQRKIQPTLYESLAEHIEARRRS